jgi:ribosomal protein L11 methyltransferase
MTNRSFKLIHFTCRESTTDILIAELSLIGYDSFLLHDDGFEASILEEAFHQPSIDSIIEMLHDSDSVKYIVKSIPERNWNREWERNYSPIVVDDYCQVKASFHNMDKTYPVEITIDPRMSFGTGHHDTTYLMIKQQLGLDFTDKSVLDAGCGTGILSILAEKLGALLVFGLDIDHWAYENSIENLQLNACKKTRIIYGNIDNLPSGLKFDIILANINLNIIIKEIQTYFNVLNAGGLMVLSGFYISDLDVLNQKISEIGLILHKKMERNKWLSVVYKKIPV